MARSVTVIPPTIHPFTGMPVNATVRRRVAAYARVSTDSEEQQTSYEAQVDYYTRYIQAKPEWDFVKVYTDDGITAVNTRRRDGFKTMVKDALDGKIDLIITKSVSRFARNTVDSLVTVRKLREHGVEVYFEKENIYTLDSKGELLITIMSSLAQEESRSISENVTWGKRKQFADGKMSMSYKHFLGFEKGEDGLPKVIPQEAALIRRIYSLFMQGKTPGNIAAILTKEGIPTPGEKTKWRSTTILSILTNEKYKGAALLQKTFTTDFLTKKKKVNEGEIPQYYIEHSHEAIIDPVEFAWVQAEIARRKTLGRAYSGKSVFATKLICADCGSFFGSKVWQSNTKYRKTIWQCNGKFKETHTCTTPHITEEEIKQKFVSAYNTLTFDKAALLEDCRLMQEAICDCSEIDQKLESLYREIEVLTELIKKCVEENAQIALNQREYLNRYNSYVADYEKLKRKISTLEDEKQKRKEKAIYIGGFIFEISELGHAITEFDEQLWMMVIDSVIVHQHGKMVFKFRNGVEIEK